MDASLTRRFFAFIFDMILVFSVSLIIIITGILAISLKDAEMLLSGDITIIAEGFVTKLFFFIFFLYHIFFLYNGGQTPAKALFKIKVIRDDGGEVSFIRSCGRTLFYFATLSFIPFIIVPFLTKNHKALHDLISGTRVIETGPCEEYVINKKREKCFTFSKLDDQPENISEETGEKTNETVTVEEDVKKNNDEEQNMRKFL